MENIKRSEILETYKEIMFSDAAVTLEKQTPKKKKLLASMLGEGLLKIDTSGQLNAVDMIELTNGFISEMIAHQNQTAAIAA